MKTTTLLSSPNPNLNPNPTLNPPHSEERLGLGLRLGLGRKKRPSGFTLIELTISAAVASIILVAAYLCLSAGVASQKMIEPRTEVLQSARVALAMMSADLRSACSLSPGFRLRGRATHPRRDGGRQPRFRHPLLYAGARHRRGLLPGQLFRGQRPRHRTASASGAGAIRTWRPIRCRAAAGRKSCRACAG